MCYVEDNSLSTGGAMPVSLILDDLQILPFDGVTPHRIFKNTPIKVGVPFQRVFSLSLENLW